MLPLARGALFGLSIFAFMDSWNGFLVPLLVLRDQALRTIPLGLIVLFGVGMTLWKGLPAMIREAQAARLLDRKPGELVGWVPPKPESSEVRVRLRDGREVGFDLGEDAPALVAWLSRPRS